MNRVLVDPITRARLESAHQKVEMYDDSGRILGHFLPLEAGSPDERKEPQISDEEIERRLRQGGGRSLLEIMADLEKRT
jgi:hypothetical protein